MLHEQDKNAERSMYVTRLSNYAVSEKEVGYDDVDKDDKGGRGDRVTWLTGRLDLQGKRLHWAVLGFTRLFWIKWAPLGCTGLKWWSRWSSWFG